MDALVAFTDEAAACDGDQALLQHVRLTGGPVGEDACGPRPLAGNAQDGRQYLEWQSDSRILKPYRSVPETG